MKSQWKKRKTRKTPPPIRRMGADFSIDSTTCGSPLNDAIKASQGPSVGFVAQIITHGNNPRTIKTAKTIPQRRNQRLARAETVPRT